MVLRYEPDGAATVLGWAGHELQWRGPLPELGTREADMNALYRDAAADAILKQPRVLHPDAFK